MFNLKKSIDRKQTISDQFYLFLLRTLGKIHNGFRLIILTYLVSLIFVFGLTYSPFYFPFQYTNLKKVQLLSQFHTAVPTQTRGFRNTDCLKIMILGLSPSISLEIVNWSEYAYEH